MRVGNRVCRKQMVVPTMCKLVLFGPFYSKIGLDPCITTVVKETKKKNIYIHILSSTALASMFTIAVAGLCPVDFIYTKKRVRACEKSISKYDHIPTMIIKNFLARMDILLVNMLMALVGLCFALVTIF